MSQNLAQTRLVDPILTTHAQGYRHPANVGHHLFPTAFVGQYGGQVIQFSKESFRLYNGKRAPGARTLRVEYGFAGVPYAIVPNALEAVVPFERMTDANAVPGVDLARVSIDSTLRAVDLGLEVEQATIARTAGNYDANHKAALVGAARWKGANGDPLTDIETAKAAIRTTTGIYPNTLILSATSFAAAKANTKVKDAFKYTTASSITTAMLAGYFDVPNVQVGLAVSASGAADAFSDVWGDDAVLAYVAPPTGGATRDAAEPSFGYTYTITGMPMVETPYQDRNAKSWVYPVTADRTPVLSGILAGYLIQNAGGAPA